MKKKKLESLKQLQGAVLGIEMELKLLSDDLETVERNIIYLNKIEGDLLYNIKLHKSNHIVSVVSEYRKSINQLATVRKKLAEHKSKKFSLEAALEKKIKNYEYYNKELEVEFERVNSESVILLFRKDRKK